MDIKIGNGDWVHTAGKLELISGEEELLQHATLRLSARRSKFYGDSRFGSLLYTLRGQTEPQRSMLAMQYAGQALESMEAVWPQKVVWQGERAVFTLLVRDVQKEVEISI